MTENERIAGANNSQTLDKGWGRILLFLLPTQIKDGVVGETLVSLQMTGFSVIGMTENERGGWEKRVLNEKRCN
jgi:hypothetical protein